MDLQDKHHQLYLSSWMINILFKGKTPQKGKVLAWRKCSILHRKRCFPSVEHLPLIPRMPEEDHAGWEVRSVTVVTLKGTEGLCSRPFHVTKNHSSYMEERSNLGRSLTHFIDKTLRHMERKRAQTQGYSAN